MKIRFFLILLFSLVFLSELKAQPFNVEIDTLFINIKEIVSPATNIHLTHAVKYRDKYYCFFQEEARELFQEEAKYFLIISNQGQILNNIEIPEAINTTVYFDFFLRKDSLLAKTYMDNESFYFDLDKMVWTEIKEVDDRVYEDENFAIAYLDLGEWGETTWFIDKKTQKQYVLGTRGTIVSLWGDKYYLTNRDEIREIENPLNLKPCDSEYYYPILENKTKFYEGSNSLLGSTPIYKDSTIKVSKRIILTSFVSNDELFQLYLDSNSTFIGKIENNKLIPLQNIGHKYLTFDWNDSYRGNNLGDNERFLKFYENDNTFGFIEIKNRNIAVHYLSYELDTLKHLASDGFEQLLALLKDNPSDFSLEQVADIEHKLGGIDTKNDRVGTSHNGYYPKTYSTTDFKTKEFLKVQNNKIEQKTEYLYSDNEVKSIFIEWLITRSSNQASSLDDFNSPTSKTSQPLINKQEEIVEIITNQLGYKPKKKHRSKDSIAFSWALKNGIEIVLYGSDKFEREKDIRMIINLK